MKSAHDIVNHSGYPLQIHLAEWINNTYGQRHRWNVLVQEHRWVHRETNIDGYIDLVLDRKGFDVRLVIECKRIYGSWTFLIPTEKPVEERKLTLLCAQHIPESYSWPELNLKPKSFESSFCVMETSGQNDSRTLERLSGELLLSLEHLALEETRVFSSALKKINPDLTSDQSRMFYLPVIVTTAKLQTIAFDPSNIDIKNGRIDETKSSISDIDFIRLRKNLTTTIKNDLPRIYSLKDVNRANDRSVFIVQAEKFIDFIEAIGE